MLENIPVWTFEPNWTTSVGETLEWLTDVMMSPTGSEQRRSMRYYPRQSINFTIAAHGAERSFLDNLLMTHGAGEWYLPIWFDPVITTGPSVGNYIPCRSKFIAGTPVFIKGDDAFGFQYSEVISATPDGLTVSPPITPIQTGTIIYPMKKARLVEQPALTAMSDAFVSAEAQFLVTANPTQITVTPGSAGLVDLYRSFYVFTRESDWSDRLDRGVQRLLDVMNTDTGTPETVDTANRPFPTQNHKWLLDGRGAHTQFYTLLQYLRGRTTPVWVPTWMYDMRLTANVAAGASSITVAKCGFTLGGGPRPEREDIMIETVSGARFYRRITDSVIAGDTEILLLSTPLSSAILATDVVRICFMSLMRLDQDSIEIEHLSDLEGVSEVQVTFRAAPNTRTP